MQSVWIKWLLYCLILRKGLLGLEKFYQIRSKAFFSVVVYSNNKYANHFNQSSVFIWHLLGHILLSRINDIIFEYFRNYQRLSNAYFTLTFLLTDFLTPLDFLHSLNFREIMSSQKYFVQNQWCHVSLYFRPSLLLWELGNSSCAVLLDWTLMTAGQQCLNGSVKDSQGATVFKIVSISEIQFPW